MTPSPTAPQGNVTQISHEYVTEQEVASFKVTSTLNVGEAVWRACRWCTGWSA
jgi:hypothetical protein